MCFLGVERLHGTAVEDLAFHRAPLQHPPLGAGELVEPGLEKRPQGRGHVHLAALRRHREHLRQEERIAAGRLCHPAAELGRKLVADQDVHLVRGQRLEPQRDRPLAASREQVGPARAEEQDRPARREEAGGLDEVEERVRAPMDVVEHADDRGLLEEELAERPGDLLGARGDRRLADEGPERRGGDRIGRQGVELPQDFRHRPVGDARAVGEAAAADQAGVDSRQSLAKEPRLADPRVADDCDELAPFLVPRPRPGLPHQLELVLPADEGQPMTSLRDVENRPEPVGGHALRLALELERLDGIHLDAAAHDPERGLADQDLAGPCRLLEPGGDVDRVSRREALLGAGHDLAGVDAEASLNAEIRERFPHLDRGPAGAQRVVLVHAGDAEDGHHRVADELLHAAAVRLDDPLHALEVVRQQHPHRLGIGRLAELGRADEVAEEHGDGLALLAGGRQRGQRGAALLAEVGPFAVLVPAARAGGHPPEAKARRARWIGAGLGQRSPH